MDEAKKEADRALVTFDPRSTPDSPIMEPIKPLLLLKPFKLGFHRLLSPFLGTSTPTGCKPGRLGNLVSYGDQENGFLEMEVAAEQTGEALTRNEKIRRESFVC